MNRLAFVRAAIRSKSPTPIGSLARGMVAGGLGAAAQSLFFTATRRWAPEPTSLPKERGKPEPQAQGESSLETVAGRTVHGLMQRGPLDDQAKTRVAGAIHYLSGAMWGGVYALCRESFRLSPMLFGAAVWFAGDNLLLPAFRLAAWPQRHSLREHQYALQAHFVYGLSTAAAYALLRDLGPVPAGALPAVLALQAWGWLWRTPPMRLVARRQPLPRRIVQAALVQKVALA